MRWGSLGAPVAALWARYLDVDADDPYLRRHGQMALRLLAWMIAIVMVFVPISPLLHDGFLSAMLALAGAVLVAPAVPLARRGRVDSAVAWIVTVYLGGILAGTFVTGQIGEAAIAATAPIALAGVTLRPRAVLIAVGAATSGLLLVHAFGPAPRAYDRHAVLTNTLVFLTIVGVASMAGARASSRLRQDVRDEAAASRVMAGELAAANAALEDRVADRTRELEVALDRVTELASELSELADRDPLTGLFNRRHLDREIAHLEASASDRTCLAVVDIDHFKRINDTLSHEVGDAVLVTVARLVEESVRSGDSVTRMGGEELAVTMPGTSEEDALVVCERIRDRIARHGWERVAPGIGQVTVSVGLTGSDDALLREALRRADGAMYRAKADGRNRVVAATGPTPASATGAALTGRRSSPESAAWPSSESA